MLHLQKIVGGPLNVFSDLVPMRRPVEKRAQNEHVQGALEQAPWWCVLSHGRRSTLD